MIVIPNRADGEGTRSCQLPLPRGSVRPLTEDALFYAKAIERERGPSARFASLGMTCVAILASPLSPDRKPDKS
jgi:hypothetical protein